jgi:hypothetical protein
LLLPWEIRKARAVYKYYSLLIDGVNKIVVGLSPFFHPHSTKKKTTMVLADANKSYKARSIRQWADQYLETGELQKYKQGQDVKTFSLFIDETNRKMIQSYLRELTDEERTPSSWSTATSRTDYLRNSRMLQDQYAMILQKGGSSAWVSTLPPPQRGGSPTPMKDQT